MNKKYIVIIFFVAFFFGLLSGKVISDKRKNLDDTFEAGWAAAKKRLYETGFIQEIDRNRVVKTISGVITTVSQDMIVVKIAPLEPIADPELDNRTVEINKNTKIFKIVEKNLQKYQEELETFKNDNEELLIGSEFEILKPTPYMPKEISIKELMVGQIVNVKTSEDILNKKQFIAQEIIIKK